MNHAFNRICSIMLSLLMLLMLVSCGAGKTTEEFITEEPEVVEGFIFTISDSGVASWLPVDGATGYEYKIVDSEYCDIDGAHLTKELSVILPEGKSVHLRAVMEDGSYGEWQVSEYYGTPTPWEFGSEDAMIDAGADYESAHRQEDASGDFAITLGSDRYATWPAVDGAVSYRYSYLNSYGAIDGYGTTWETTVRVPLECGLIIDALNDSGDVISYGRLQPDNYYLTESPLEYPDLRFNVTYDQLYTWNLVENIDYGSITKLSDGGTGFSAAGPNGSVIRFETTPGVTVEEGNIRFVPGSMLYALDSIGRICAYYPTVSDFGDSTGWFYYSGGYTFNGTRSVEHAEDLFIMLGVSTEVKSYESENSAPTSMMAHQPNMIAFGASETSGSEFAISEFTVYYDESMFATPVRELHLFPEFYGTYLEGDLYDPSKERYDSSRQIFDFYLLVMPDIRDEFAPKDTSILIDSQLYSSRAVLDIDFDRYQIGELKDADGNLMNKETDPLMPGATLEITIANGTYDLELPVLTKATGVENLHELTPYGNAYASGDVTALVVPIVWPDKAGEATDALLQTVYEKLGRVVDISGTVTDYSGDPSDGYSLSAYYDLASYGQYSIESFVTDWITAPYSFADAGYGDVLAHPMTDEILTLVRERYPDMDWSKFDRNQDGILDSVIYITACGDESMPMQSYGGAVHVLRGYDGARAGTLAYPNVKNYICVGSGMLSGENILAHEFAHSFGIVDYYDVTYSGIDAVGGFDLQSQNVGDWNPYSKYAVGWIEPEIVTDLETGESVEITIGALSETGDAIVIPAAGADFDGPFGEYIMIDLFNGSGLNAIGAARYNLDSAAGVRIYHVNARMEYRELLDIYGGTASIGTVNVTNAYNDAGIYHVELIQKGGDNTFTDRNNLRTSLQQKDLFYAGDTFQASNYSEFLRNGRMDDGSEFGYIIEVISITGTEATVRVTRT